MERGEGTLAGEGGGEDGGASDGDEPDVIVPDNAESNGGVPDNAEPDGIASDGAVGEDGAQPGRESGSEPDRESDRESDREPSDNTDGSIIEQIDRFFAELHRIDVAYADYARRVGLSDNAMTVLDYLRDHDGATQRAICDYTMLPRQTINNIVASFAERGLVELGESDRDRRAKTVRFTEAGRRYCNELIAPSRLAEYRAMSELDGRLRDALLKGMEIYGREFRRQIRVVAV